MTKPERENWLCSIHCAAAEVAARFGEDTLQHKLHQYGADAIEELPYCVFSEVFDDLSYMAGNDFG